MMTTGPLKLVRRVRGKTGTCSLYERGPEGSLIEVLAYQPYRHRASAQIIEVRRGPQAREDLDGLERRLDASKYPLVEGCRYRLTKPRPAHAKLHAKLRPKGGPDRAA
jgi:hypothetical protein